MESIDLEKTKWRIAMALVLIAGAIWGASCWSGFRQDRLDAAMITAIQNKDWPTANRLIARGANPNATYSKPTEDRGTVGNFMNWLHSDDCDCGEREPSALMIAVNNYGVETGKLLLQKGANPNWTDNQGFTILEQAAKSPDNEIASLLLRYGADVDDAGADGDTALHRAAESGSETNIVALLEHHAKIDTQNFHSESPLFRAVIKGHTNAVRLLLQLGSNPIL